MTDIKSMTMEELKNLMTEIGEKPFRAKQIYAWLRCATRCAAFSPPRRA